MARPHAKKSAEATTLADIPCPFCCCACDDLQVRIEGRRITSVEGACEIAQPFFLRDASAERPSCRIDGKPAQIEEALQRAAELLCAARYPLIYGLSRASCEAARIAVDIAETLGGVIDVPASRAAESALHSVGGVTATFGEIRNRADLLIAWGVDPVTSHPRFFERYAPILGATRQRSRPVQSESCANDPSSPAPLPQGERGDGAPKLIAIDSKRTSTVESADEWIAVRAGGEFDAATVLQGLAKGLRLSSEQLNERTGVELGVWQSLFERMRQARYGVLLTGDADDSPAARRESEALAHLVRELTHHTRFVSIKLRSEPNGLGAENVLAWRTGYSAAVGFSHGFPRHDPDELIAEKLLAAGRIDAALVICEDPLTRLSAAAQQRFTAIPSIALDWQQTVTMRAAGIAIPLATVGVESGGTIFRADGVPLALRPPIAAQLPADHEALGVLRAAIVEATGKCTPRARREETT